MTRSLRSISLALALLFVGCGHGGRPSGRPELGALPPGPILSEDAIAYDFQWRQRVTIEWGEDESGGFDAVLTRHDGALLLLGLTPMGTPAFTLTLNDGAVTFGNRSGREFPFEPDYILADIQRVFFPWLGPPPTGFDGERSGTHEILQITEQYRSGRLVERVFRRTDAPDRGAVRVRYDAVPEGGDAPTRAVLESEWFEYRLTVETVAQQRL